MKINLFILQKDNSIVKRVIQNPSEKFEVDYIVDGGKETFPFNFDRSKIYKLKGVFGTKNICFYEHGSMNPLDAKFSNNANDIKEINQLVNSKLIGQLVDSAKSKGIEMSTSLILGSLGILALVLIVIFG